LVSNPVPAPSTAAVVTVSSIAASFAVGTGTVDTRILLQPVVARLNVISAVIIILLKRIVSVFMHRPVTIARAKNCEKNNAGFGDLRWGGFTLTPTFCKPLLFYNTCVANTT
jgi:hypothetical protein